MTPSSNPLQPTDNDYNEKYPEALERVDELADYEVNIKLL